MPIKKPEEPLRRLNFFTGLFTKAEDWQKDQEYHLWKRQLLIKALFVPGVFMDHPEGGLKVTASPDGLKAIVGPGYAIDSEGRDIYLLESVPLTVEVGSKKERTVYIAISYDEEQVDRRDDKANPNYSGYAFWKENPKVRVVDQEPNNQADLELARIRLQEGMRGIKEAADPANPGPNEIDRRSVKKASLVLGRPRLTDLEKPIKGDTNQLAPQADETILLYSEEWGIPRYHMVSVIPYASGARFSWTIHSEYNSNTNKMDYWLYCKNISKIESKAKYQVLAFRGDAT